MIKAFLYFVYHDLLRRYQFTYNENNRLPFLNGDGLKSSRRNYVASTDEYISWKANILETVGYEDGGRVANITILLPDGENVNLLESFVDLSLGIIPHLETTHIEIKDMRFGIEAPELTKTFDENGIVTIDKPVNKGLMTFRLSDYSRVVTVEVDFFTPSGFGFKLNESQMKVRFSAPFIELICSLHRGKWQFSFTWPDSNENYSLLDMYKLSQVILLLFESRSKSIGVQVEIIIKDLTIQESQENTTNVSQEMAEVATKIESAWLIARYFDIEREVNLSIFDILNQKLILPIRFLFDNQPPNFTITYWFDIDSVHEAHLTYYPQLLFLRLGEYIILIVIVVVGHPEKLGNIDETSIEWKFVGSDIHTRREICFKQVNPENTWQKAKLLLNSTIDSLDDSQQIILSDDIQQLIDE